jgi:hypothetical protein
LASAAIKLTHDPEKWTPVFHRDNRKSAFCARIMRKQQSKTRLRFELTQSRLGGRLQYSFPFRLRVLDQATNDESSFSGGALDLTFE